MRYVYGPVNSRRLGRSLGVSLVPYKTCSFDCVYCQLGRTTHKTTQLQEYIDTREALEELAMFFKINVSEKEQLHYITLSGFGEPTLNSNVGNLITGIKNLVSVPVCILTNSSLLMDKNLRQSLSRADLIVPTLNAVTQGDLEAVSRPHPKIKIEDILSGLIALRKEYSGQIWLEVMAVKGINDDIRKIKKLKEVVEAIRPNKIQLNSPIRFTAMENIVAVEKSKLTKIKDILGESCEIL